MLHHPQGERRFQNRVRLLDVSWDNPSAPAPMDAHLSPQESIAKHLPPPSQCDVVLVILWARMGTPYEGPDGTRYLSGTEYECREGIAAAKQHGTPRVWIFRRSEPPPYRLGEPDFDEHHAQWNAVEAFVGSFRRTARSRAEFMSRPRRGTSGTLFSSSAFPP
jgi:hypothetical protein